MEDRSSILRELRICRFCLTEQEPLNNIYVKDKNNAIPLPLQIMACVALEVCILAKFKKILLIKNKLLFFNITRIVLNWIYLRFFVL